MKDLIQVGSSRVLTMSSREIAELCGKELSHVHRDIRAMLGALIGMEDGTSEGRSLEWSMTQKALAPFLDHEAIQGVRFVWDYRGYAESVELPKNLTLTLVSGYNVKLRKAIIDKWQELEARVAQSVPDIPKTLREALLLAADLEAKREEAEARALEAERTKAQIGSRREATAMAKASAATRRVNDLEIQLDESRSWATVKRMEIKMHQSFDWRPLKNVSKQLGIPIRRALDENYGEVNAYRADVWKRVYALDINGNA
jgi:phage regulator Rha-like protein